MTLRGTSDTEPSDHWRVERAGRQRASVQVTTWGKPATEDDVRVELIFADHGGFRVALTRDHALGLAAELTLAAGA